VHFKLLSHNTPFFFGIKDDYGLVFCKAHLLAAMWACGKSDNRKTKYRCWVLTNLTSNAFTTLLMITNFFYAVPLNPETT
jgi:hypothetical protein